MKTKRHTKLEDRIRREAIIKCWAEPEQDSIEGNCSAIDEKTDAKAAAWIREQLDMGNEWAWAAVTVAAEWNGLTGEDHRGCCSYKSKEDFCTPEDGYYPDMVNAALSQIVEQAEKIRKRR